MTKQVQRRRGTSSQHTSFTGAEGEISVNTSNKTVHVHDGSTAGGFEAALASLDNVSVADVSSALSGVDNIDINGGTIDGTTIGGNSAAAITGTTVTGTSFVSSGNMTFGDNDKAIFGAGSDLQIYHQTTGTAGSYISENGTGDLRISGNNLWLNDVSGDTYFRAVNGSYAKLYHAGDEKISTTSTGVDVTGTITSDGLTVEAGIAQLELIDTGVSGSTKLRTANAQTWLEVDPDNLQASSGFATYIDGKHFFNITDNGDISFYEDTGTTAKFFWDASAESLGIGTSSPDRALHISSSSAIICLEDTGGGLNDKRVQLQCDTGQFEINSRNDDNSNRVDNIFVADLGTGNVGIGTSSPTTKLMVEDTGSTSIRVVSSDATDARVKLRAGGNSDINLVGKSNEFYILDGSTERMRIDSNGNVGIGTSSPLQALHVNSGTGNSAAIFESTDATAQIWLKDSASSSTYQTGIACFGDKLLFNNGGERMVIDSSGNVGIGTSSPGRTLDVQSASGDADVRIYAQGTTSADDAILYLGGAGTTATNRINFGDADDADRGRIIYGHSGDYMSFTTAASEALRITSSGNVGIGTSSPSAPMQVVSTSGSIPALGAASSHAAIGSGGFGTMIGTKSTGDGYIQQQRFDGTATAYDLLLQPNGGNVLVGTTDSNVSNNSGTSNSGINLLATGQVFAAYAGNVANFNQLGTSGGSIINFDVDGSTVGAIAAGAGGFLTIGSPNGTPVYATFANGSLKPTTSLGSNSDGSGDLGNTSSRWKDLYLSGGVYLGGTGAANKLDDYEEGTFNPEFYATGTDFSSVSYDNRTGGTYTKIGRVVHIQMTIISDAITVGSASGDVAISGLPFPASSGTGGGTDQGYAALSLAYASNWSSNPPQAARVMEGSSTIGLYTGIATTATVVVAGAGTGANDNYVNITGTYITDA